ncbi:PepSY domain-containing protein [Mesorhizobium sp. CC13]|uniref:PepSY domain-containing protein n=1 Tax=Mesorhizobium sp. CC13 TaxID=3029194 RepID=UPI003265898A
MTRSTVLAVLIVALFVATQVQAQTKEPPIPPEKSLKLSEIIARIEQRGQFRYVSEVEWNREGYYDVIYYTTDKAKVEIKIDVVSGEPRL